MDDNMAPKNGLGKSMGDLLGTPKANTTKHKIEETAEVLKNTTQEIEIDLISPNKQQPRKMFNEDALEELSESIKEHGIIEPLVVSKKTDSNKKEYYQIVAGERRWRAAKLAGIKKVPVVVKEYTDHQILEIALIENIQREDLNPIEEAQAYSSLIKELSLTQDQLAERVSKSRTAITNSMRLLKLSKKVQQMVIDEKLTAGHVRTLLSIEDKNMQYEVAQMIFDNDMSVRQTEEYVKRLKNPKPEEKQEPKKDAKTEARLAAYKEKENEMKQILKTNVTIDDKGNKGRIVINYSNLEEFERIFEWIQK